MVHDRQLLNFTKPRKVLTLIQIAEAVDPQICWERPFVNEVDELLEGFEELLSRVILCLITVRTEVLQTDNVT